MIRCNGTIVADVQVPNDQEYLAIVKTILSHKNVQSMQGFIQHGTTSCLEHSINVSYLAYLYCKTHGLDAAAVARAGLLHDLFLYDWHDKHRTKEHIMPHGFTHPADALRNAERVFDLNEKEKDMILRHMWPLTIIPPKSKEGFVLLWFDKFCSMHETFHRNVLEMAPLASTVKIPATI